MFANYKPVKRAVLKQGATRNGISLGWGTSFFGLFFSLIYCSLVLHKTTDGICFNVFNKFVSLTLLVPKETASVNEWGVIFLWRRTEDLSLNFVPYFLSAWCIFCSRLNNITSQSLFCYFFTQRGSGPWGRWHYQRHSEGQRNFEPFIKRLVHAILCFFWKRKEKGGGDCD